MKYMLVVLSLIASGASGEVADYGRISLTGLARESWPYNPAGQELAMVCNVNGPDGFLSIRSGPGTQYDVNRRLNRLAILEIDTRERRGHWVRVRTAYRTHSQAGALQAYRSLHVTGWAHDGYLCDFIDY